MPEYEFEVGDDGRLTGRVRDTSDSPWREYKIFPPYTPDDRSE